MLKKTVLNAAHRALNARMVDFGGWDMPVNYGSQIEEHHAVRNDCGMFDVSHMCAVDVTGDDAKTFLLRLTANKDLAWMDQLLGQWQLDVSVMPLREGPKAVAMIAVQGPQAKAKVWQV